MMFLTQNFVWMTDIMKSLLETLTKGHDNFSKEFGNWCYFA